MLLTNRTLYITFSIGPFRTETPKGGSGIKKSGQDTSAGWAEPAVRSDNMTPLSIVVVAYDMARELPRTLRSLAPGYQREIRADDYEVVVVDNGSPRPIDPAALEGFPTSRLRVTRLEPAPSSPARAANIGLDLAGGDLVGLLIDGARLASPGLLACARLAAGLAERPVIATLGWHLGPDTHMRAEETGYDQSAEDNLLARVGWEEDGYRLFGVSALAGSSRRGWFGPLGESNALFLKREMWSALGGLDERFSLPGGGRVNHDLFRRACALAAAQLIVLLGEGTFHQVHGGVSTSGRVPREQVDADYERITGVPFEPPPAARLFVGTVPQTALPHLRRSVEWACRGGDRRRFSSSGGGTRQG
jgi:hypothetical protein